MRIKIQKTLEFILIATLLVSYSLMTAIVYHQTLRLLQSEVRQEAEYIQTAVNISGSDYLDELKNLDAVDAETRVTWITADGDVKYDSKKDVSKLGNHASRPEIANAIKNGTASDIRTSGTLGQQMYYYAVKLDDGTILRLSKTTNSMVATALEMLPITLGIAVAMLIIVWLLSKWQTLRIIKPINDLNLENPLENDVYEELTPLLTAIDTQNKEKDAIAQMRKEFSANVSHELKTPLTSISGYAEIMMNGIVKTEDIPTFSERIYKEAKRLITLVEDIIKLSKLDEESVELEKEDVNLYELTREIATLLTTQAEKKHVRMEISGGNVVYHGIRQILDEMIYNICENAIKYNKDNGEVRIWVGKTLEGPKIVVADTGIGIPKEHQDRIFERFYRVDKSHSKERGGTGLGLSIVKHGAILHDIKVDVKSEENVGTKITLLFH